MIRTALWTMLMKHDWTCSLRRYYDAILPTRAGLIQHIKRTTFQAGCIWAQETMCKIQTESTANWAWEKDGEVLQVFWANLPPYVLSCEQLTKCDCKAECQKRCKLYRFSLKFTLLCAFKCEDYMID